VTTPDDGSRGNPFGGPSRPGYFKIPREVSIVELSGRFGMTDKQVSRDLHRALDQCLRENLLDDPR
jgi:predicted DNA binding protein